MSERVRRKKTKHVTRCDFNVFQNRLKSTPCLRLAKILIDYKEAILPFWVPQKDEKHFLLLITLTHLPLIPSRLFFSRTMHYSCTCSLFPFGKYDRSTCLHTMNSLIPELLTHQPEEATHIFQTKTSFKMRFRMYQFSFRI